MAIGEIKKQGSWGWCVLCEKAIEPDVFWKIGLSDNYKCPFEACDGAGIGIDLWEINEDSSSIPEAWPSNEAPVHGEMYSLYNSVYDATQDQTKLTTKPDGSEEE